MGAGGGERAGREKHPRGTHGGLAGRALALAAGVVAVAALPRAAEVAQGCLADSTSFRPLRESAGPAGQGVTAVVLGFALDRAGRPSPPLEARIRTGVQLLQQGRVERLVFSGGHPGGGLRGGLSEAEVMRRFAEGHVGDGGGTSGAGPLRGAELLLEDRSTSTRENALYSLMALAQEDGRGAAHNLGEVVVVTSCFHQWRARRVFRRAAKQLNLATQVTVAPLETDSDFGSARAFERTLQRALQHKAWAGVRAALMVLLQPVAVVLDSGVALFHVVREILAILLYFSKGWIAF